MFQDRVTMYSIFISAFVPCESAYVAFTVGLTNHLHLSHGQLSYNKVITNSSAEFDSLGFFVCRKPGLYAFHFFSRAQPHSGTWIELLIQSTCVLFFGYTAHGYAGNSVQLHLNEDDKVSLKAHPSYSTTMYGTGHVYTTFTGVLLNLDETGTKILKKTLMQIYENQTFILMFILIC